MNNEFYVGDRVVRVGPHLARGGRDWGDQECKVGYAGVVLRVSENIHVRWDNNRTSAIIPESLVREPVSADEEAAAIASILKGASNG